MVILKALYISKTTRIMPPAETIAMIIQRERMPVTSVWDTVNSDPSCMDYPSAHFIE